MRATRAGRTARFTAAVLTVLAACACSSPPPAVTLTVLVSWGGSQLTAFRELTRQFTDQTGIAVNVEGTRALTEELGADLLEHAPPDIAALPSLGAIVQYKNEGLLQPLDSARSVAAFGPPWSSLMRPDNSRHVYAVPVKVDVKSLIWYAPAALRGLGITVPATLARLSAATGPAAGAARRPAWCLAMESPPTSGWPGADWIADILLSRYGTGAYQEWVSGKLAWTSPQVTHSWQQWGALIGATRGGAAGALSTAVGGVNPARGDCLMQHGALIDEGFAGALQFPRDYDFFRFPGQNEVQVSGDFIGVFATGARHKAAAIELVDYLISKKAQESFVLHPGVDGFSASSQVPLSAYQRPGSPAPVIARLLSGGELCFGAADAMPPLLSTAFYQAVLEYLAAPAALPKILREMQGLAGAVVSPRAADPLKVCGRAASAPGGAT